ncbi:MAG TPA: cell surface protein, partial [Thermoplasmatales archaeon]|nr:cell surface protein [Thermoplasmatales archaeon]
MSLKLGEEMDTTAAVSSNSIYVGSDMNMYCISLDGEIMWSFTAGDIIESSPALGLDGTIYFGCNDGYLYALKPSGELKWKFETTGVIYTSSPSIGADGTIYIGDENGHVFAVNPDGTKKWESIVSEGDDIECPIAIGVNGTIYVTTYTGGIYAIGSGSSGENTQQ